MTAETSWFPGASPGKIEQLMANLLRPKQMPAPLSDLTPLARANMLAARLEFPALDDEGLLTLDKLIQATAKITVEQVLRDINDERKMAGFPSCKDHSQIDDLIAGRRRYYTEVSRTFLDRLATHQLIPAVSNIVKTHFNDDDGALSPLAEDIVSAYEINTRKFADAQAAAITTLISRIKAKAREGEGAISGHIETLRHAIQTWRHIMEPVQAAHHFNGLEHEQSNAIAFQARSLLIDLHNEYAYLKTSAELADELKKSFAHLPEFIIRIQSDQETLEEIRVRNLASEREESEFFNYSAEIGLIFKDHLKITPDMISWSGQTMKWEDITAVRWGSTRHSVNGVPTKTIHDVYLRRQHRTISINLRDGVIFNALIERVWRGAGARLVMEYAKAFGDGKAFLFGSARVDDHSIMLERRFTFRANERVRVKWADATSWSENGVYHIGLKGDDKVYQAFPYLTTDNIQILEFLVRASFKAGGARLSAIAE
jgi:hypothetical protein